MINIDISPLLKGGISRYSLVVAVAKRSRAIADELNEIKKNSDQSKKNEQGKKLDQGTEEDLSIEKPVSIAIDDFKSERYVIRESDEAKNS